ncbi:MAG TPA: response regulator transcription factor [Anaerolineales bacterium]|nr:response regulator transcription factor [Anaerolineales bacterium]
MPDIKSMTLIAVVEDEPSISEVVSLYLKRAGYQVQLFADGLAAQAAFSRQIPDLIILDVMLPGMDGFSLTRSLRDRSDVPIILLTSRREESDRIAGLELGADDYVVKPFSPQELVSRVRAVLRRISKEEKSQPDAPVSFPNLSMDPQTRVVVAHGQEISLTAKEFELLYHFIRHPHQVFSRDQLLEAIWGLSDYIDSSTVTVHIRRLREKIETDPSIPAHLQTVWGVGYKFEP